MVSVLDDVGVVVEVVSSTDVVVVSPTVVSVVSVGVVVVLAVVGTVVGAVVGVVVVADTGGAAGRAVVLGAVEAVVVDDTIDVESVPRCAVVSKLGPT